MQFNSPLIYILLVAAAISFYLKETIDACIILIVIIINAIIGCIQEVRADEALEALKKLSSPHSYIKVNGQRKKILSSDIQVGDILILEEGLIIAADAEITSCHGLQIDESSLTGESVRIEKQSSGEPHLCHVYESTVVVSGHGEARVIAIGKDTEFGKISQFVEKKKEITPLQIKLNDLSKILGLATILICLVMFLISMLRKGDIFETLITSISLAVAVIPEGLMAVVTITLSIGVQKLVNVNTIVRHLPAVETLGSVSLVCSDKTGTITENNMKVEKTLTFAHDDSLLIRAMILCNNATLLHGDPTEVALIRYGSSRENIDDLQKSYVRLKEIPFSSESKMMSVTCRHEQNEITFSKGAYEVIVARTEYILEGHNVVPLTLKMRRKLATDVRNFYDAALRVLAFSYRENGKEIFIGFAGEKDPIRSGVCSSVETLREAGIKTVMITGDHKKTAQAIGEELGIVTDERNVCLGSEIDGLDDRELKEISVFARVAPLDKMKIVSRYKKMGYVTAMTGDGVNDAPSLKEADVGIAMGKNGTEVAKSVADIILTDDNFSTIGKAIETGRVIYDNIKKAVVFLLSSNFAEVLIMFLCLILNLPLPLIAIHILWVNLISDSLPALALGSDRPEKDVMKQKPRKKESSILANGGWRTTIVYGIVICMITFIAFIILPTIEIVKSGEFSLLHLYSDIMTQFENEYILRKARTMAFTVLGISELFHMIGMSDPRISVIQILKKKNYFMFAVILLGFFLQIIVTEIPFLVGFFKTEPLSFIEWIWLTLLSAFPLVVHEVIRK